MDKLLGDMDALCQLTAKEREERYRASCRMARISEMLFLGDEITCDGGIGIRVSIETGWDEQQLTSGEMTRIRARDDRTCKETLQDMVDELQDMIKFLEFMDMVEDCSMNDILNQLNASISAYNEGI